MKPVTLRRFCPAALGALALGGCATTARMHSQEELAGVARSCAVPLGNVAQFEEEPRLVFLMSVQRPEQFACMRRWARRRHLQLVYMEDAELVE
jgi:hypothetical protein